MLKTHFPDHCKIAAGMAADSDDEDLAKSNKGKAKAKAAKKGFKCTETDCDKLFTRQGDLLVHVKNMHTPARCWMSSCANEEFIGTNALLKHMNANHPAKGRPHPTIPDHSVAKFLCVVGDYKSPKLIQAIQISSPTFSSSVTHDSDLMGIHIADTLQNTL